MKARLIDGARASDVAATVIPVKHAGWQNVAQLVVPSERTVYILEVDALAQRVFVVVRAVEERLGQPARVIEVVGYCKRDGLPGREVLGRLNWATD
jgi:hypothetical protein